MSEEVKQILGTLDGQAQKAITYLEHELAKIRAGKANPQILESIHVDYYGNSTPLFQVANVNTPDARTLVIQPWEKSMLAVIEKAIQAANLGFNPQNDGTIIRINIPPLTEERRKELVKRTKQEGEQAKIVIRNSRREALEAIKRHQKSGLPEDMAKDAETKVQHAVDSIIKKMDNHLEQKEKEIMTV